MTRPVLAAAMLLAATVLTGEARANLLVNGGSTPPARPQAQ